MTLSGNININRSGCAADDEVAQVNTMPAETVAHQTMCTTELEMFRFSRHFPSIYYHHFSQRSNYIKFRSNDWQASISHANRRSSQLIYLSRGNQLLPFQFPSRKVYVHVGVWCKNAGEFIDISAGRRQSRHCFFALHLQHKVQPSFYKMNFVCTKNANFRFHLFLSSLSLSHRINLGIAWCPCNGTVGRSSRR